jgi:hypothetical protein
VDKGRLSTRDPTCRTPRAARPDRRVLWTQVRPQRPSRPPRRPRRSSPL